MNKRADRLVFLDLETSDSDENKSFAAILEVGITVTDIWGRIVNKQNFLGYLGYYERSEIHLWDEVVLRMHTKNELLFEILKMEEPEETLDQRVHDWLTQSVWNAVLDKDYNPNIDGPPLGEDEQLILAGSGVSHFDRRWIRKFMPKTDKLFTHYAIDIGVFRRMTMMHSSNLEWPRESTNHRALNCNQDSINQYVAAINILKAAAK